MKPGNVSSCFEKDDYYTKDDLGVSAEFHGRLAEKFGFKDAPFDRSAFDNFVNGRFQDGIEILQRNRSRISKDEATELFSILNRPAFAEKRLGIVIKNIGFYGAERPRFSKEFCRKILHGKPTGAKENPICDSKERNYLRIDRGLYFGKQVHHLEHTRKKATERSA